MSSLGGERDGDELVDARVQRATAAFPTKGRFARTFAAQDPHRRPGPPAARHAEQRIPSGLCASFTSPDELRSVVAAAPREARTAIAGPRARRRSVVGGTSAVRRFSRALDKALIADRARGQAPLARALVYVRRPRCLTPRRRQWQIGSSLPFSARDAPAGASARFRLARIPLHDEIRRLARAPTLARVRRRRARGPLRRRRRATARVRLPRATMASPSSSSPEVPCSVSVAGSMTLGAAHVEGSTLVWRPAADGVQGARVVDLRRVTGHQRNKPGSKRASLRLVLGAGASGRPDQAPEAFVLQRREAPIAATRSASARAAAATGTPSSDASAKAKQNKSCTGPSPAELAARAALLASNPDLGRRARPAGARRASPRRTPPPTPRSPPSTRRRSGARAGTSSRTRCSKPARRR